jgi:heme oxygenase
MTVMRAVPPVIARCRAATSADHRRVEETLDPGWLAADPSHVDGWLLALLGAHRRAEAALGEGPWCRWPGWRRSEDLAADLARRGGAGAGPAEVAVTAAAGGGDRDGPGWSVGVLYVLEGSALGSPALRRMLVAAAPGPCPAPRFLHPDPSPAARWARLCALAAALPDDAAGRGPETGAAAAFSWFASALSGLRGGMVAP